MRERKGWLKVGIRLLLMLLILPLSVEVSAEEASVHLEDYSEKYGAEPIDDEPQVKAINQKSRSMAGQEVVYLAVFLEFPDLTAISLDNENTLKSADMIMNTGGRNEYVTGKEIPLISLKEHVAKYTYGAYNLTTGFFPKDNNKVKSHVSTNNRSHYLKYSAANPDGYTGTGKEQEKELIDSALTSAKATVEATYSAADLDSNNDGKVDAISFFVEAPERNAGVSWGHLLWSHKANGINFETTFHGKTVDIYNLIAVPDPSKPGSVFPSTTSASGAVSRALYGVIHHEFMHTLGLPDLYRGAGAEDGENGSPVGFFDIMAAVNRPNPQGLLSVLIRDRLNAANPLPIIKDTTESVILTRPGFTDKAEKIAVKIESPFQKDEYFVVEFYTKQASNINSSLTGRSDGIIVYRVNKNITNGNIGGASNGLNDEIFVFRPGETNLGAGLGTLGDAVILPKTGQVYGKMTDETGFAWDKDALYFIDGTNSGIKIEVISSDSETAPNTIELKVTVPETEGSGTPADPYLLSKPADVQLLKGQPDKYFKLKTDIDFAGVDMESISKFSGELDGNGKILKNITVKDGSGLFTTITSSGVVKDLILDNISITEKTGTFHVGALAGDLQGKAERVTVTGGTVTGKPRVGLSTLGTGGFVGTATNSAQILDCATSANVSTGLHVGGFVGLNQGAAYNGCYANGTVTGGGESATESGGGSGGFSGGKFIVSGNASGAFTNCAFDMAKTGKDKAEQGKDLAGVTGFRIDEKMELDLNGVSEKELTITSNPHLATVTKEVIIEHSAIATYKESSNKIVGVSQGQTAVNVNIAIGSVQKMTMNIVVEVTGTVSIPITGIAIDKTEEVLEVGAELKLNGTVYPENTTESKNIQWSSSDVSVATVDVNGNVRAIAGGVAEIYAKTTSTPSYKAVCKIKVVIPAVGLQADVLELHLKTGETKTVQATLLPTNTTDTANYTWTSNDESVAQVSLDGTITAISVGNTIITVRAVLDARTAFTVEIPATVYASEFSKLDNQYQSAKKSLDDLTFIADAPQAYIDNLKLMLSTAQQLINSGEAAATEDALIAASTALSQALDLFIHVPSLKEIASLKDVNISLYDKTTINDYKAAKVNAEAVLADPIGRSNNVNSVLAALKEAKAKMILLNAGSLTSNIAVAEAINLAEYLDGDEKTEFALTLANAKKALTEANTNQEYDDARLALEEAIRNLVVLKKATDIQKKEMEQSIIAIQNLLKANRYLDQDREYLEAVIEQAKKALSEETLTEGQATVLLEEMKKAIQIKPDEPSAPQEPSKPNEPGEPKPPSDPQNPSGSNHSQSSQVEQKSQAVKSGDDRMESANMLIVLLLMSLSIIAVIVGKKTSIRFK